MFLENLFFLLVFFGVAEYAVCGNSCGNSISTDVTLGLGLPIIGGSPTSSGCRKCPINTDSSDIEAVDASPRLLFSTLDKIDTLVNKGNTVKITANRDKCSYSVGGVAGPEKYFIFEVYFVWSCDPKEPSAATLVTGRGVPLMITFVYVNEKYKSVDEAKLYQDGMIIAYDWTTIDEEGPDNEEFKDIEPYLRDIKKYNASVEFPRINLGKWIDPVAPKVEACYYAYCGNYVDYDKKKKQYKSAIIYESPGTFPSISRRQYNLFCELEDENGETFDNKLKPASENKSVVKSGPFIVLSSEFLCECLKK